MNRDAIPADEILKKARAVGQYYGFVPLSALTARTRGSARAKGGVPELPANLPLDSTADTMASFLKLCRAAGLSPSPRAPLFLWHTNIAAGRPAPKKAVIHFHALGTERMLADAVVIRALLALARDLFHEEPLVRVNSMGDKETRARYARELASFFKRRAAELPEECVNCAKRDALAAAEMTIARACAQELPAPTEHLSDMSRKRFEELLEYLEATETPYELARDLISRGNVWNDVCFEIMAGERRVAWGSRYHELAKHFFGTAMPATGAVLTLSSSGKASVTVAPARTHFAFVHIGDEAKRLSILLADEFKKARVPLAQDIGVESLTEQMNLAERKRPAYFLIMGRKEALEHSAILRNRETQEETVLPLEGLAERLKTFA